MDREEFNGGCLWLIVIPVLAYLLCSLFSLSFNYKDWNSFSNFIMWVFLFIEICIITDLFRANKE